MYQGPDKLYFQLPPDIKAKLKKTYIGTKVIAWKADLAKILELLQRKYLDGTHLLVTVKEIHAGYLTSIVS